MSKFELAKKLARELSLCELVQLWREAAGDRLLALQLAIAIKMECPSYE